MDRMLLDLNLPPPPYWSPPSVSILSPTTENRPHSPEILVRRDDGEDTVLEYDVESGDSRLAPSATESREDNGFLPDADASTSNHVSLQLVGEAVFCKTDDSNLGNNASAGLVEKAPESVEAGYVNEGAESLNEGNVGFVSESLPKDESLSGFKEHGIDSNTLPAGPAVDDVEDQLEEPGSAKLDSTNADPTGELLCEDGGGPVKVHKRLRTLGQLRSRKKENAAANSAECLPNAESLEDEIGSDSGGKSDAAAVQDDGMRSVRATTRASNLLRNRKGNLSEPSSNGESTLAKCTSNDPAGIQNKGDSKSQALEPHLIRRFPKIPSQPRSRNLEKRPNLVPPPFISKALREEPGTQKETPESTGGGGDSGKVSSVSLSPWLERGVVGALEEKSIEPKDQSQVSSDVGQPAGLKRPGGGLKDAMPGKRRRQTVLLDIDVSLKPGRPLRTPTSEGTQGRVPRGRRDTPRLGSSQLSEKQDNQGYEGPDPMEASSSRKLEDPTEDSLLSERSLKPLPNEGIGQFRRPALKRQPSASFSKDDTMAKGSSSFSRDDYTKGPELAETRNSSSSLDGLDSQKPQRIPRKTTDIRKQAPAVQDASVERLHREATCSELWQTTGASDLQKVPGKFDSVEDYVRVLEPLLFEECRAQLHSTWEELLEGSVKDAHVSVTIKGVERRERGWYDVVVLPENPHVKFKFKEGDVAVLSTPKPGLGGRQKGRTKGGPVKEKEGVVTGRITGIVRRYYPIDVRDPPGAVLHFHVSQEEMDNLSNKDSTTINGCAMKDLDPQLGVSWYLTVLGGVTTTQREYVALHFLQQFHPKMLSAVLQPRPELFPGYADQEPPAMPECFTPAFVQHLRGHFNGPQLAAIQWAGAHTAAGGGTSGGAAASSKQEPWPFTLVQGPPGTGKTHTVWGMLNVIHLVQYQRYYQALLKKLAPNSVVTEEVPTASQGHFENGSIDDVLQRMDDSLARMLPKLCPKPRMLVCAPSNAATDELLSRVLDRGFIDGEMKVYRPDVARVGSDPHSRAAQAVSVERRSEQLLAMGRDQVLRWLQQLKGKETQCSQLIASLQRDLNDVAATRSQGNLGVDPDKLAAQDQVRDTKLQQLAALVEDRDKLLVEMSRFFIVEGRFRPGSSFSQDDARQKLEASFANEAEIVFTTVSSSGRRIFTKLAHGFDMVVIDEAAQASEVAVLPPLSLRAARCVLVGDPQQLPATVISRVADTMQYSRSLFERFQQAGCPAILLSVQYRMHPQIRDFPSRYFYQGRLVDSESVKDKADEGYHKDLLLQPYLFYDISQGRESHGGSVSYQNKLEAQVAVRLYLHLQKVMAAEGIANVSVGMITPYKQQLRCLQSEFEAVVGVNADVKGVYINTVDAFQGQERDVIMMSCVRASTHGVGFVADIRRMNVALTRARRSLWVIGNATALMQSEDWAALLADAKARSSIVETATCIARGLLPENPPVIPALPQAGSGLLRHARPGLLPVGRMESSTANVNSHFGPGGFSPGGFEQGRQQDDQLNPREEQDRWPVSGHRGSRLHRDSPRGGFGHRGLLPSRSFGRGSNMPFRRGRG